MNSTQMIIESCKGDPEKLLEWLRLEGMPACGRRLRSGDILLENDTFKIVFDSVNAENGKLLCTRVFKRPEETETEKMEATYDLFSHCMNFTTVNEQSEQKSVLRRNVFNQ